MYGNLIEEVTCK